MGNRASATGFIDRPPFLDPRGNTVLNVYDILVATFGYQPVRQRRGAVPSAANQNELFVGLNYFREIICKGLDKATLIIEGSQLDAAIDNTCLAPFLRATDID